MPYIGNSPGTGTRNRFIYTATASQTTFSGADDNGKTLKYADSDYVDVYLNGICLVPVTDYTSTSKTSIVLTQAASLNDTLEVVAYDIATISDTVSKADGGTFEDGVTIITADNDFRVETTNNANTLVVDASTGKVAVATGTAEDAQFIVNGSMQYASRIIMNRAYSVPTASFVDIYWKDDTYDLSTNYIYRVQLTTTGTGTNTGAIYHVYYTGSAWVVLTETLHATSSNNPQLRENGGRLEVYHNHGSTYTIRVNSEAIFMGNDEQTVSSVGLGGFIKGTNTELIVNEQSDDTDFRVESDNASHMLFVDAGNDSVLFNISTAASGGFSSSTKFVMNATGGACLGLRVTENSAASINMIDFRDGDDQRMGEIVGNASNNTLSYGTSSDRSKKENDRPIPNASERVSALNPVLFDWISDGTSSEGFIAQELERDTQLGMDAVNGEDGEKTVDYGKLTPLLTAALQEALAKIEVLEDRISALEAK